MARVEVSRPKRARSEVLSAARLGDRLVLLAGHGLAGHAAAGMALGLLEGDEDLLLVAAVSPDVVQVPDPVGVREFARRHLAGLEASQRTAVGGFLIETLSRNWHTAGSAQVGEALCVLREALRERLPHAVAGPESAYGLHVETISRIDDSAFYIRGWARHATSAITSLVAVSPEGSRTELIDSLFSHPRADIDRVYGSGTGDRPGFRSFFATDLPSFAPTGWIVEARTASGDAFETQAPAVAGDAAVTGPALLAELGSAGIDAAALLENHIGPALSRLGRRPTGLAAVSKVIQVGAPPQAPADIALIIVVDHRVDLIEHQLVQFARDPEVSAADIVYVLNRPETAQAVRELAPKLYRLYGVPFRLALHGTHTNFAQAVNAAASLVSSRLLVIMHGDTLPDQPGWLGDLRRKHDSTEGVGATGVKLLHEDDSIQQAGISVIRRPDAQQYTRLRLFEGFHRRLGLANESRPVEAVSSACVMVEREVFERMNGYRSVYLEQELNDIDFCQRLREMGLASIYFPEVELYHLDGHLEETAVHKQAAVFDDWLFNRSSVQPAESLPADDAGSGGAKPHRVEVVEVVQHLGGRSTVRGHIDPPKADWPDFGFTLEVRGWVLGPAGPPRKIEVIAGGITVGDSPPNHKRPALAERFPDIPDAAGGGFRLQVSTVRLPRDFKVDVRATFADGAAVDVGTVSARRAPLGGRVDATPAPLMVTTLGRTGSTWVVYLLGQHPSLVAYRPFVYEPRVGSYWAGVLASLAEPASYEQLVNPDLDTGAWWLGDSRIRPLRHSFRDPEMGELVSGGSVESLARFCQGQMDRFYRRAAFILGREKPAYFVEKTYPGFEPVVLWDLYPNAKEILLVRDVRDMLCSIFAFNKQRGFDAFGRESTSSDEEFVSQLGKTYDQIVATWHARSDRAHLLRYEDLILKPTETLADILRYLNVDASAATIQGMLDSVAEDSAVQADHRTAGSPAASVGRWKQDLDPKLRDLCLEVCGPSMAALGYE